MGFDSEQQYFFLVGRNSFSIFQLFPDKGLFYYLPEKSCFDQVKIGTVWELFEGNIYDFHCFFQSGIRFRNIQ